MALADYHGKNLPRAEGPQHAIALRASRLPEWQNSNIGLHPQIKQVDENKLAFRCTVNNNQSRV